LGFNVIPQAVAEKSERVGTRQVALTIVLALLGAMLFYVLIILMTASAVPREELLGEELPAYTAVSAAFGSTGAGKLVLVAGLLGLLSTWNAIFYASTRTLLVLARAGTIPAGLAAIDARFRTPAAAIALTAVIGAAGTLLGPAALVPMVSGLGTAMTLVFAMIALGVLITRSRRGAAGRLVPAAALLVALALLANGLIQAGINSAVPLPPEWVLLAIWSLLGLLLWLAAGSWRRAVPEAERRRILLPAPE